MRRDAKEITLTNKNYICIFLADEKQNNDLLSEMRYYIGTG